MNLQLCLKLVTASALVFGATTVLSQPSQACPAGSSDANCPSKKHKPVVTTTTTPPQVVPIAPPVGHPSHPIGNCGPGGAVPCAQPPVATPLPQPICQPGVVPCLNQPPVVNPPMTADSFFCGRDRAGRPTTFVSTPRGVLPLVKWVSHYFSGSGYNPEVRCQEVSQRFDLFYRQGRLNFITTGIVNRLPVVCVASQIGGPCTGVLFTLKSGEDASRVIQQLFDVRVGASGPLYESGTRPYIDVNQHIQTLQPE